MTVTVGKTTDLVVPRSITRRAGLKTGDELEFRVSAGVISIVPKRPVADEYTPAQRRVIDRDLTKGLDDIKAGRLHGPFRSADEAIAHFKLYASKRKRTAPVKKSR